MSLHVVPPLPGSVLRHQILNRMRLKQAELARAMGVSAVRINHIVNGKAPITPSMALRLAHATNTEAEYWLSLQASFDLFEARERLSGTLEQLPKLTNAESE